MTTSIPGKNQIDDVSTESTRCILNFARISDVPAFEAASAVATSGMLIAFCKRAILRFLQVFLTAGASVCQVPACDYNGLEQATTSWRLGTGWTVQTNQGAYFLRVNVPAEGYAWWTNRIVDGSWVASAEVNFVELLRDGGMSGTVSLAFSTDHKNPGVRVIVDITLQQNGSMLVRSDYFSSNGSWIQISGSAWFPVVGKIFRLEVQRTLGRHQLVVRVLKGNSLVYQVTTGTVADALLDRVGGVGLRGFAVKADVTGMQLVSPISTFVAEGEHFRSLGVCAVSDLLSHFWQGDAISGQVLNTFAGYAGSLPDSRGVLWERAILLFALDGLEKATGDPRLMQRIAADWARTKLVYPAPQLEACGPGTANPACDDAGWSALMYLVAYRATGDSNAVARARGLLTNSLARWKDNQLGGGMWYSDARNTKSLYQAALIIAGLRLYDLGGDPALRDEVLSCADWIESHLRRGDGLYWCDYSTSGPVGLERPYDINEADSVTFLGGNLAMGVINAWRYYATGDDNYRQRAVQTAEAIYNYQRQR